MKIPALNPNLTADERRAVARSFARDAARETVRGEGAVRADMDRVEAEALVLLLFDWVEQALAHEEAAP